MKKTYLSQKADKLSVRFVNSIKSIGNEKNFLKSCYFAQGHSEQMKNVLVHDDSPISRKSIQIILSYNAIELLEFSVLILKKHIFKVEIS